MPERKMEVPEDAIEKAMNLRESRGEIKNLAKHFEANQEAILASSKEEHKAGGKPPKLPPLSKAKQQPKPAANAGINLWYNL